MLSCHSKSQDNDLAPPLPYHPPMNQPATSPSHTHKRPQFLIYRLFSSCPPFPYRLRKSSQSPPKLPSKNESITRTIVTAMKKHLGPFHCGALPQHAPQKLPKSHLHTSKHLALLPFSFSSPAYALHALQAPFLPPISQHAFTFMSLKFATLPTSLRPLVWHPPPT